jgi:hypothetical protein
VAAWDRHQDLQELLRSADLALYAAKAAGGDRTEVALAPVPAAPSADAGRSGLAEPSASEAQPVVS